MNRLLIGLILGLSASSLASAQSGDGTILWWKLDETSGTSAIDASGNNRTGFHRNGPVITTTSKATLQFANAAALTFDGVNDVVDMGNATPFGSVVDNFTMSFWARPTATVAVQDPASETTTVVTGTSAQRYAIFPSTSDATYGANSAAAGVSIGTNGIRVYEHAGNYMPALLIYNATIAGWAHVAVVYTNRQPALYLNGALVRTGLTSPRTGGIRPGASLSAMAPWTSYGQYAGDLDDVRIYPRSLTSAEVSRLALGNAAAGTAPNAPTHVQQSASNTGARITFSADITDPTSQVLLEVEVRPAGQPFTGAATATSPLQNSGTVSLTYTIPASGPYDWRYRAGNASRFYYTAWTDFAPISPDFTSDQTLPTNAVPVSPVNADAPTTTHHGGPVEFVWTMAADDGGAPVTYDVTVSTDDLGVDVVASSFGVAATSVSMDLPTSQVGKFWRVRAVDAVGNAGAWSDPAMFRVTFEDGLDHGAGDAAKRCGFSATGGAASLAVLLALLLLRR